MKKTLATIVLSILFAGTVSALGTSVKVMPAYQSAEVPSIFIYELKPGDTIEDSMLVENALEDESNEIRIYSADGYYTEENYKAFTTRDEEVKELGAWITITDNEVVDGVVNFKPGELKEIDFKISIPEDAEQKDYIGGFAFEKFIEAKKGNINTALRFTKDVQLKVTDNPRHIEKTRLFEENLTINIFEPKPFFWVSISIFLACMIYLIISYRKEKKQNAKT